MALVLADRVRETTTTTGTGAVTLGGAYTGFQTFSAGIGNGNTTYYTIANVVTGEWEVGIGTYTAAGNTLSRDTVLASSNSGSLVNFVAGSKDAFVTQPAERAVYVSGTDVIAANSASVKTNYGGTGLTSWTAGDLPYYASGTALNKLAIGTTNQILTSSGTAPQWSSALTITGLTDSGNLTFTGTGNRITGDFSNATVANRVMFQTSSAGSNSVISAIPNGAATQASFVAVGNSTPTNASYIQMLANGTTDTRIISAYYGTGTFLPMTFYTGGSERMRIDTSGNVGIGTSSPNYPLDVYSSTGLITRQYSDTSVQSILANYSTNTTAAQLQFYKARGTQASPTIVLSGDITGRIQFYGYDGATLQPTAEIRSNVDTTPGAGDMPGRLTFYTTPDGSTTITERMRIDTSGNVLVTNPAGLGYGTGSGGAVTQATSRTTGVTLNKPTGAITMFSAAGSATAATFTVTNSVVAATDTIILNQKSGTNLYVFLVTAVAAGSFNITFYTTGGTATDAPVINFAIIKGATS